MVLLSIGEIGGADRTFACKSQECLWQDWYIFVMVCMVSVSFLCVHVSINNLFVVLMLNMCLKSCLIYCQFLITSHFFMACEFDFRIAGERM